MTPKSAATLALSIGLALSGVAFASSDPGSDGGDDEIEDDIEERVEDQVDDEVDEDVADAVEDAVEANVEDQASDAADRAAEDKVDDAIEDALEDQADAAEDAAEDAADAAEDAAEKAADAAEDAADDAADAAEDAADDAADRAEDLIDDQSDALEEQLEEEGEAAEEAADDAADAAEDAAEDEARAAERGFDDDDDNSGPGSSNSGRDDEDDDDNRGSGGRAARRDGEDAAERSFEQDFDEDRNPVVRGELLAIMRPEAAAKLQQGRFTIRERTALDGIGRVMLRIVAADSRRLNAVARRIERLDPEAEVDVNHLYTESSGPVSPAAAAPSRITSNRKSPDRAGLNPTAFDGYRAPAAIAAVGVIDTAIDAVHPALKSAAIDRADFVRYDLARPNDHGTSIASILVGADRAYQGLAPRAALKAASVFFKTPQGGVTATAASLVQAIDWFVASEIRIVNMSITGPANDVLKAAVARAHARGLTIVAAVGNDGPAAALRYPAAYPEVVAVTAVDARKSVYRLANRGPGVDFAAPGVAVRAAVPGSGYGVRSGTSFAAPFVVVALAAAAGADGVLSAEEFAAARAGAEDLGAAGVDAVYGAGYIRP